jgi:hypothetical protein
VPPPATRGTEALFRIPVPERTLANQQPMAGLRLIRKILIDVLFAFPKCEQSERFGTDGQIPTE